MAPKNRDGKSGDRRDLRVVGGQQESGKKPPAGESPPPAPQEAIFGDNRSGRDRREEAGQTHDSRRKATSDRRQRGRGQKSSWWLERDYVESHHFVQKSSSSRGRKRERDSGEE